MAADPRCAQSEEGGCIGEIRDTAADDHGMKQPVEQSSGEDRMTEEVAHSAKQVRSTALPDDCFRAGWSAKLRK